MPIQRKKKAPKRRNPCLPCNPSTRMTRFSRMKRNPEDFDLLSAVNSYSKQIDNIVDLQSKMHEFDSEDQISIRNLRNLRTILFETLERIKEELNLI